MKRRIKHRLQEALAKRGDEAASGLLTATSTPRTDRSGSPPGTFSPSDAKRASQEALEATATNSRPGWERLQGPMEAEWDAAMSREGVLRPAREAAEAEAAAKRQEVEDEEERVLDAMPDVDLEAAEREMGPERWRALSLRVEAELAEERRAAFRERYGQPSHGGVQKDSVPR